MSRRRSSEHGWLAYYGELLGLWTTRSRHSHSDREDAVHDAVLSMLENGVGAVKDLRAYLGRASHNKLVDIHRRRSVIETVTLDELAEHEHPHGTDAEATVRASLLNDALQRALEELPLKCRQVFIWNKIEGRTQEEIALTMGLSQSMVEKYMKRALDHLYDRLQNYASH
ncbi:RNA polymerase ECF-subfamily sigma-70 factor [Bordetella genomosp. 10]|uniref:RNA polymerase ECF-subfamily sigma-70 factor n=1 Tax=Bordetella genomosp. 10 TaxID=1416804 RepID=A0A261S3U8_9BORD|nr:sigma-70 family RNA polymerase sigma factor [Bordetella genomosp. 10]OZI31845.1 RNA polymerase ECF-subfamily sigma-70 factor [Bordetella genomosp. 10]